MKLIGIWNTVINYYVISRHGLHSPEIVPFLPLQLGPEIFISNVHKYV